MCRLVRTTKRNGVETVEIDYAITSVPRDRADAGQLLAWWRGHWGIENRSHYVRDVTFGEGACQISKGDCTWKTRRMLTMLRIVKK